MSDLVGNLEDHFSHNEAHIISLQLSEEAGLGGHSRIKLRHPEEPNIVESNYSLQDDAIFDLAKTDLVNIMKLKV